MAVNEGQRMWLTPRASESNEDPKKFVARNGDRGPHNHGSLTSQVMWPTPQVDDAKNVNPKENRRETLVSRVNKWPTPRSSDVAANMTMDNVAKRIEKTGYHSNLEEAVAMQTWPTPNTSDAYNANMKDDHDLKKGYLRGEVMNWPTPSANEDAAGRPEGNMQRMLGNHPDVRGQGEGTLNPLWVTWLMGLPVGWVSLDPLSIEEYQEWLVDMTAGTWWDTERDLPRVAQSVSGRVHMLKALGNGIVPEVVAEFLKKTSL